MSAREESKVSLEDLIIVPNRLSMTSRACLGLFGFLLGTLGIYLSLTNIIPKSFWVPSVVWGLSFGFLLYYCPEKTP